jgi:hypothetical protein
MPREDDVSEMSSCLQRSTTVGAKPKCLFLPSAASGESVRDDERGRVHSMAIE